MTKIISKTILSASLPLEEFSQYLHLSESATGFTRQDTLLENALTAAIYHLEARIGRQIVPTSVLAETEGSLMEIPYGERDMIRIEEIRVKGIPALIDLNLCPIEVKYGKTYIWLKEDHVYQTLIQVGYSKWSDIPKDLAMAFITFGSVIYSCRGHFDVNQDVPGSVLKLIEPYRDIRVFGGRV